MRNTSRKMNLYRTNHSGSLNVSLIRKKDGIAVKEKAYGDSIENYITKVYLYQTLIFTNEDGENRFFTDGHRSRTTITALNTILRSLGFHDIKFKTVSSDLWIFVNSRKVRLFEDGLSVRDIYQDSIEILEI